MNLIKYGGLHEKHAIETWNLGSISAFAWKLKKTKQTYVEMAGRRTFRTHTVYYPAVFPNTSVVGSVENFNTLSSQKATYLATEPAVLVNAVPDRRQVAYYVT
jgi:hypothetical protein